MRLTDRVNRISVSPTMAVLMAAERLKASGADVVDFGPGEPDFITPEHIRKAAIRAVEKGYTKYTPTPGIASITSPGRRSQFQPRTTKSRTAVATSTPHATGGASHYHYSG